MIGAGFTIHNPITQSRTVVVEGDGTGWVLEAHNRPHAAPDVPEHLHVTWTERFEILTGSAHYTLDGVQQIAQAGDTIVVEPGHRHVHPWNAGETELVYRQIDTFDPPDPHALGDVIGVFATVAGWAREGKIDGSGRPKNPLRQAVVLKALNKHGGYDAKLPVPVQRVLAASLGTLGEVLGYKAVDARYIGER